MFSERALYSARFAALSTVPCRAVPCRAREFMSFAGGHTAWGAACVARYACSPTVLLCTSGDGRRLVARAEEVLAVRSLRFWMLHCAGCRAERSQCARACGRAGCGISFVCRARMRTQLPLGAHARFVPHSLHGAGIAILTRTFDGQIHRVRACVCVCVCVCVSCIRMRAWDLFAHTWLLLKETSLDLDA